MLEKGLGFTVFGGWWLMGDGLELGSRTSMTMVIDVGY